jgi:hypothetical protein
LIWQVKPPLRRAARGNKPEATITPQQSFFDMPSEALQWVFNFGVFWLLRDSENSWQRRKKGLF